MDILNQIAAKELKFPKVGSVHPCHFCGEPDVGRFLGVKRGKGQWKRLKTHTPADCDKRQEERKG